MHHEEKAGYPCYTLNGTLYVYIYLQPGPPLMNDIMIDIDILQLRAGFF